MRYLGGSNMKKTLLAGVILSLVVWMIGCTVKENKTPLTGTGEVQEHVEQQIDIDKLVKEEITNLVKDFGRKLQSVSLLSLKDILEKSIEENYSEFVSQELMKQWIDKPENAPGRLVSSPWPDRIEVESVEKLSDDEYKVEGKIIEITSNVNDKAISRQITLTVKQIHEKWLIDDVVLGEYE